MTPDTDTEQRPGEDAEQALESQADELEERVAKLGDDIDEAKKGLRARKEDADDGDDDDGGRRPRSPSTTRRPTRTTRTRKRTTRPKDFVLRTTLCRCATQRQR